MCVAWQHVDLFSMVFGESVLNDAVAIVLSRTLLGFNTPGVEVNSETISRGLNYLRDIESKCRALKYSEYATRSCMAYALYVRNLLGDQDVSEAKTLYKVLAADKNPNLDAIGWLWPTLTEPRQRFHRTERTETTGHQSRYPNRRQSPVLHQFW